MIASLMGKILTTLLKILFKHFYIGITFVILIILFLIWLFLNTRNMNLVQKFNCKEFYDEKIQEIKEKKINNFFKVSMIIATVVCSWFMGISLFFIAIFSFCVIGSIGIILSAPEWKQNMEPILGQFWFGIFLILIILIIYLLRLIYINICIYKILKNNWKSNEETNITIEKK